MAKVLILSTQFPAYHPKAGQPTFFIPAFYASINYIPEETFRKELNCVDVNFFINGNTKHTTIRKGKRFKKGDFFSPRIWGNDVNPKSGRSGPYHSKQIIIAEETEVLKTFDFRISPDYCFYINGIKITENPVLTLLANNDGLSRSDFDGWFRLGTKKFKGFDGQIICWNENINY